jgi:hypothetical protein
MGYNEASVHHTVLFSILHTHTSNAHTPLSFFLDIAHKHCLEIPRPNTDYWLMHLNYGDGALQAVGYPTHPLPGNSYLELDYSFNIRIRAR